jgi:anti-anti-sigma factor
MNQEIQYKEQGEIIFIRAIGHITANNCYLLRKRIFDRLENMPAVKEIYLDLADCSYMDSTFMGIIIGVNKKFKSIYRKRITVVCPSKECCKLFAGLGIAKLLQIKEKTIVFPENMELISLPQKPPADMVLKAHEDLMETSPENRNKFKLLQDILKKKLKQDK